MSSTTQTMPIQNRRVPVNILIAVSLALTIGVVSGSVITQAVIDRDAAIAPSLAAPLWDQQKLDAMEGRMAAASVSAAATWDPQKLEAMEGRQLAAAATLAPISPLWDQQKLDAMEGRQLAEQLQG